MEYKETEPCLVLQPLIHSFWELKGGESQGQWERNFPDGCPGLVVNIGDACMTDNGSVVMESGKTYAVGAMTSFKDSFIDSNTHLVGVCLRPGTFSNFYNYTAQNEFRDSTVELEKTLSLDMNRVVQNPAKYLNQFYTDRMIRKDQPLLSILEDIHNSRGHLSIYELAKRNFTTVRQVERNFKVHIGITPKEYSNIVRFQNTLNLIKNANGERSLLDIAFECGFYDHAHLANDIRRHTGLAPTEL